MRIKYGVSLILVLVIVFLGAFNYVIQTPEFWQKVIVKGTHERWEGVRLKNVHIEGVHVAYNGSVEFKELRFKLKVNADSYMISVGGIRVSRLWDLLNKSAVIPIAITHVAMVSDSTSISELNFDGNLYFQRFRFDHLQGVQNTQMLEFDKYKLSNVSEHVMVNDHQVVISQIEGAYYKGVFKGEILMDYVPQLSYSMSYTLTDIDLEDLAKVDSKVWGNMKGIFQGEVQYKGDQKGLREFKAHLRQPSGGMIKASMLGYLAQYIPQRSQLESLIKNNEDVPLEKAELLVSETSDDKLSIKVKMASAKLYLNMNVDFDINVEGGVLGLSNHLKQLQQ